ncbi:MAG: hypothetical protein QGH77_07250 [Planctomycetota bacterium]|nr:hypothetical protein [Planctomycetota bacterium]
MLISVAFSASLVDMDHHHGMNPRVAGLRAVLRNVHSIEGQFLGELGAVLDLLHEKRLEDIVSGGVLQSTAHYFPFVDEFYKIVADQCYC